MNSENFKAVAWQDDQLCLLDQRLLPDEIKYIHYSDVNKVAQAITDMVVRGAPAIGITAAYGIVLSVKKHFHHEPQDWYNAMQVDLENLRAARPTAVNLMWAIDRMNSVLKVAEDEPVTAGLKEAKTIHEEDIQANQTMGQFGAELLPEHAKVLTHCNAGALATGGYGTALGVIRAAQSEGILQQAYASETRPWLQGARLTAWELMQDHIPVKLVVDSAANSLMQAGEVDWVIVGSDRIAANGDVANKIGTCTHAITAKYHGLKVMVVAPSSTVDMSMPDGASIEIENRQACEVTGVFEHQIAPDDCEAVNPAFDITPAELIDVIVTEKGVVKQPNTVTMQALFGS